MRPQTDGQRGWRTAPVCLQLKLSVSARRPYCWMLRALKKIESPQAGRSAVLMSKFARMHHTTKNWRCEDTDIARRGSWEMNFGHETCRNVGE